MKDSFVSKRRVAVVGAVLVGVSAVVSLVLVAAGSGDSTGSDVTVEGMLGDSSTSLVVSTTTTTEAIPTSSLPQVTSSVPVSTIQAPPASKAPTTTKRPTTTKPPTNRVWPNNPPTPPGATLLDRDDDQDLWIHKTAWQLLSGTSDTSGIKSYVEGLGCAVVDYTPGSTMVFECPGNIQGNVRAYNYPEGGPGMLRLTYALAD